MMNIKTLFHNLLFEYQDEQKKLQLIIAGKEKMRTSYLEVILFNRNFTIKETY